jgi:D-serine deaminase-like pyridoxal phosphate-dependent protein
LLAASRSALEHNIGTMAAWCAERDLLCCPHGKTSMAPELWERQVNAGAWGITVAGEHQLAVALATGCPRVQLANSPARPKLAGALRDALRAGTLEDALMWVDSPDALRALAAPKGKGPPIGVLIDLGWPQARTGVRSVEDALALARAASATPGVTLRGVAAYEGAVADAREDRPRWLAFLDAAAEATRAVGRVGGGRPLLSIGGTAWLADLVREVRDRLGGPEAELMARPGVYVAHDDGFYQARLEGELPLRAALSVWARVLSVPEPGLALADAGLRDLSQDEGLPVVLGFHRGTEPLPATPARVLKLHDQHAFIDPAGAELRYGDWVELGVSHPCTTFDRWPIVVEVERRGTPSARIAGAFRTYF